MSRPAAKTQDYESFPYLHRGADFPAVELSSPSYRPSADQVVHLSGAQVARVEHILSDNVIISFHDHPQLLPVDMNDTSSYLRSRHEFTAYTSLRESGLTAVFDNWFGVIGATRRTGWKWDDLIMTLGLRLADIAHQENVLVARTVQDIQDAHATNKMAFVLGTESAGMIENDLDRIDVLYGLGIRQMGLVYSEANTLGSGQKEQGDGGLTVFGRRAVERMNALGMLIDVSHASDRTSQEAIDASSHPLAITHAGARAVWPIARMKPDSVLTACAERGGVLGIEAAPHTTLSYDHRSQSIESVMDHFTYAVELMGIDHVAFGPDTLYGDHSKFQKAISEVIGSSAVFDAGDLQHEPVTHVEGLENPTENFRNIVTWLVEHGYEDSEIQAVTGGNILRLLNEVWR